MYAVRFVGVVVSAILFFLAGWTASAAEVPNPSESRRIETSSSDSLGARVNFDSLLGQTQIATSGLASYSDSNQLYWRAEVSGIHYISPRFGVGGNLSLGSSSYDDSKLFYGIGPVAEYFVPVSDRGHVFTKAGFLISGRLDSDTYLQLGFDLGYRYFVTADIALSVQLNKSWWKSNVGTSTLRSDGVNLNYGFSLFF